MFSAGNAEPGETLYDSNMEIFASSMHTITISSVGVNGTTPHYAKPGSCIIAATFGDSKNEHGEPLV